MTDKVQKPLNDFYGGSGISQNFQKTVENRQSGPFQTQVTQDIYIYFGFNLTSVILVPWLINQDKFISDILLHIINRFMTINCAFLVVSYEITFSQEFILQFKAC